MVIKDERWRKTSRFESMASLRYQKALMQCLGTNGSARKAEARGCPGIEQDERMATRTGVLDHEAQQR